MKDLFPALLLRSQSALSDCFLVITLPCHHMKRCMDRIGSYLHPAIRSVHFANADILLVWCMARTNIVFYVSWITAPINRK